MRWTYQQAGRVDQTISWAQFSVRVTKSTGAAILGAIMFVQLAALPASADIGACAEVKPPRNDAQALSRAGFAFDGIVIGGRTVLDPSMGEEVLVSPLRFELVRNVKGDASAYGRSLPSGKVVVTVWDAQYANHRLRSRVRHDEGPDNVIPDELAAKLGQQWRIYGLSGFGNWTATTCLGSHPIAVSNTRTGSKPTTSNPLIWWLVIVAGVGSLLGISWRVMRSRRTRGEKRPSVNTLP
jgi:hypothetical protein